MEYITAPQMAVWLNDGDLGPLWIHAADENDPAGSVTVPRHVASVLADVENPGEWIITYGGHIPGCRSAVRTADQRCWALVGPVAAITRAEYDRQRRQGRAGSVRGGLYPATIAAFTAAVPGWTVEHWHIVPSVTGDVLAPVNVLRPDCDGVT